MSDQEKTVAVPVELLNRILDGSAYAADEIRALLPKPKPRLVAVDRNRVVNAHGPAAGDWFDAQPDLLTLLDEAIDNIRKDSPYHRLSVHRHEVKAAIRAALGVAE